MAGPDQIERDSAQTASEEGFTGTLDELVTWLEDALVYGHVLRTDGVVDDLGRERVRLELVTGGYSNDEHLIYRLDENVYMASGWSSSQRGGLFVYEFPPHWASKTLTWLEPETPDAAPESTEPVAWAVYGRKTGSLRGVVTDADEAAERSQFYDVVPLAPMTPGRD